MNGRHLPGRVLAAIFAIGLFHASAGAAGAQLAGAPWPVYQHDAQHTGRTPLIGPASPTLLWTYHGDDRLVSQASVGSDGHVYVGNGRRPLCKVDKNTGAEIWRTGSQTAPAEYSTPAVAANGLVYIGARDNKLWNVLQDTGFSPWQFLVPTDGDVTTSPLIGQDGGIYMGSNSLGAGWFYKMNPGGSTATFQWKIKLSGGIKNVSPAESHDGATIFVTIDGTTAIALDPATGAEKWRKLLEEKANGGRALNFTPVVTDDGAVLIGFDFALYALDPDSGALLWQFDDHDTFAFEAPPALGWDGTIYIGGTHRNKGRLFALQPPAAPGGSPTLRWMHQVNGRLRNSAPVVDGNGDVYIAAGKQVAKLDGAGDGQGHGRVLWTFDGARRVYDAGPTVVAGRLYVPNRDSYLYAIGE